MSFTSQNSRVVLITGAAKRIGREIALTLGRAGWRVALHYRSSAAEAQALVLELQALGIKAQAFHADLNDAAQISSLVPAVHAAFGRLDALINNASLFEHDDAATISAELAQRQYMANTIAPVLLARDLHAALLPEQRGCVVNLLDQKLWNPNPDFLSYTLSKAALHSATTLLAQALAPRVRVCAVAPGVTMLSGDMTDAAFAAAHTKTPLGKSSTPADVAQAVLYLLEAGAITGASLLVDGGQHLVPLTRDVAFTVDSK